MNGLASLQRRFLRHVLRPGGAMARAVLATPRADAARRLGVYVDAYRARLVEALANDYPALKRLLGAAGFERMMRQFIAVHPSRHANLRWYGGELAAYLARTQPRRPLLMELAHFEWALGLAFDAADAEPLSVAALARVPAADWPALRFALHPSARTLRLRSNAPALWRAATRGGRLPRAVRRRAPVSWLVWRKELTPLYRWLEPDEAEALAAAARGSSFAGVCTQLARRIGAQRAPARAAQLLKCWALDGVISGIDA